MKRSGVGYKRGVDTLCDLFSDANAGSLAEVVDHLSDGGSCRIDPVDVAKESGRGMVIDIDDELLFEIYETRPRYLGTLNYENGVVGRLNRRGDAYVVCARQLLVRVWDWIAHDNFDIFIERAQQPVK